MEERLQKIIARAGIASRRHAEQLIVSGAVTVNGRVVTELGTKADAERDHITVGPRVIKPQAQDAHGYFAFYKPPQVVSTLNDPEGRPCLGPYLRGAKGRLFPVGRLEFDASGLLLLTSDGVLASDLMRATATIPQVWRFKVRGRIPDETRQQIEREAGVELRLHREGDNPWYQAQVRNAPRDIVRQTLFRRGFPVEKVVREGFGGIHLEALPPGEMRELSPEEVSTLRRVAQGRVGPAAVERPTEGRGERSERQGQRFQGARAGGGYSSAKPASKWRSDRSSDRSSHRTSGPAHGGRPSGKREWKSGGRPGPPRSAGGGQDRGARHGPSRGAGQGPSHGANRGPGRGDGRPWKKGGSGGYRGKPASGDRPGFPPAFDSPFRTGRPPRPSQGSGQGSSHRSGAGPSQPSRPYRGPSGPKRGSSFGPNRPPTRPDHGPRRGPSRPPESGASQSSNEGLNKGFSKGFRRGEKSRGPKNAGGAGGGYRDRPAGEGHAGGGFSRPPKSGRPFRGGRPGPGKPRR
jgi:23S rRNA pseudouridine2605 synthase